MHWDGRAFRVVFMTGRSGTDYFSGVAVAGRQVWAVGFAQIEHWDGRGWQQIRIKGVGFSGVDALSPHNVWAAGENRGGPVIYHYACH